MRIVRWTSWRRLVGERESTLEKLAPEGVAEPIPPKAVCGTTAYLRSESDTNLRQCRPAIEVYRDMLARNYTRFSRHRTKHIRLKN